MKYLFLICSLLFLVLAICSFNIGNNDQGYHFLILEMLCLIHAKQYADNK